MKYEITHSRSGHTLFTAEIDCPEDAPPSLKLGLAVRWGIENGTDFCEAFLPGANLRWADLSLADLRGADLRKADLYGADLRWAYLLKADLRDANLRWAQIEGAEFEGAKIKGAIGLEGVEV